MISLCRFLFVNWLICDAIANAQPVSKSTDNHNESNVSGVHQITDDGNNRNPFVELANNIHGKKQVEQLLIDRPDLLLILNNSTPTKLWMEECFAGKFLNEKILWDNKEPEKTNLGIISECFPPQGTQLSRVRVTSSNKISTMDRLVTLLFELNNILGAKKYLQLSSKVISNEITRDEFAVEGTKLELKAVFLLQHDLKSLGLNDKINPRDLHSNSYLRMPVDFKNLMKYDKKKALSHLEVWKQMFDQILKAGVVDTTQNGCCTPVKLPTE